MEIQTKQARITISKFMNEKYLLDLKSVERVKEQIEQYSARYKSRMLFKEMQKDINMGKENKMKVNKRLELNGFSMKKIKQQQRNLEHRFMGSCLDTDRNIQESDIKRIEYEKMKYDNVKIKNNKKKRKKKEKKDFMDFYMGFDNGMMIQSATLSPRMKRRRDIDEILPVDAYF